MKKSFRPDLKMPKTLTNPSTNDSPRTQFNYKRYLRPASCQQQLKQIKKIFDIFDPQQTGLINPQQLLTSLNSIGYKIKENFVYQMILDMVADGKGGINFEEFLTMLATKVTEDDSRNDMIQLFNTFDDQKTGFLTIKTLRRMVRQYKLDISEEEMQKMIQAADFDHDGKISQEEFYHFMTMKK